MKTLLLSFCSLLLINTEIFASDWFDLQPSRTDTLQLERDGVVRTVTINLVKRDSSFTSTVFLDYVVEHKKSDNSWEICSNEKNCSNVNTPTTSVNAPYSNPIIITISPKNLADSGFFRVHITAKNGPKSSNTTIYFSVKNAISRFYQLKGPAYPAKLIVSYDTSVHNRIPPSGNFKREYLLGQGTSLRKLLYQIGEDHYSFSIDKQKNTWLAIGEELYKYGEMYTTIYNKSNSVYSASYFTSSTTHHFAHLTDGSTYLGGNKGLFKIKDGVLEIIKLDTPDVKEYWVNSVAELNDTIWVSRLTPTNTFRFFKRYNDINTELPICIDDSNHKFNDENTLINLKHDRNGSLWGILMVWGKSYDYNRLVRFDGNKWVSYPALDSMNLNGMGSPLQFTFDSHGKTWIHTTKKNLVEFNGVNIGQYYECKNTILSESSPKFLEIDSLNTLYIGTIDSSPENGIILFNPDGIPLPSVAPVFTTGVDESTLEPNINMYPQPAKDNVSFKLPKNSSSNTATIVILNSIGTEVTGVNKISLQSDSRYTLSTEHLQSGLYFAVFRFEQKIYKKPFIVVK